MNPMTDLPMGFGMALVQNAPALHRFEAMSEAEQARVLAQLHGISSKKEMRGFVARLAE